MAKHRRNTEGAGAHERVLEALAELFVRQGYTATSIPRISRCSAASPMSRPLRFLTLAVALLVSFADVGVAAGLRVDNTDPECSDAGGPRYCTVQAAVAAALPRDTVKVKGGPYQENVQITTPGLKIVGSGKPEIRALAAGNQVGADVFYVDADDVTIKGFRIHGARRNPSIASPSSSGAGVSVNRGRARCTIKSNEVFDNTYGVQLLATTGCVVKSNTIHTTVAQGASGFEPVGGVGITVFTFEPTDLSTANVVAGNKVSSSDRHGVFLGSLASAARSSLSGNLVKGNTISGNGLDPANGGDGDGRQALILYAVAGAENLVKSNKLFGNGRAGLESVLSSNVSFKGNKVYDNRESGIRSVSDDGTTFQGNKSTDNDGHGIEVPDLPASTGVLFKGNTVRANAQRGVVDESTGNGVGGTANDYVKNKCKENLLGASLPAGLCS